MGIFRVGIFWVQVFRRKFTRGESDQWDFPGDSFPDAIHIYVSECIKSVYRYLVKIISGFPEICMLNELYILVNST